MAENTKIEWATHTFNPWMGCTKVSDGCKFCYAETLMDKRWGKVEWGPQGERKRTSDANWRKPIRWNKVAKETGVRTRVFCGSLCDVFEAGTGIRQISDLANWRQDLIELIDRTPYLDWLLLTKRPENVNRMISAATGRLDWAWFKSHPNVWLGTSVEDQKTADQRIPKLLKIPAKVRFLSCEPLLGPIALNDWMYFCPTCDELGGMPGDESWCDRKDCWHSTINLGLDWVIIGGESGPNARPFHVDWGIDLMWQCDDAGIACFWKQMGDNLLDQNGARVRLSSKGGDWSEWPPELRVRVFPQLELA